MEAYRKAWNRRQTQFRDLLRSYTDHEAAMAIFRSQHAQLHSAEMSGTEPWSFEDWICDSLGEAEYRQVPTGYVHSLAWILWHVARIEDVTMNMLVAGRAQVFTEGGWMKRMGVDIRHTGNAMDAAAVEALSTAFDLAALRAYRQAVGRRTQQIASRLGLEALQEKVDPVRLEQVRAEGTVVEAASEVLDYWSTRDIAGLLLMPATRHVFLHFNEALRLKRKLA